MCRASAVALLILASAALAQPAPETMRFEELTGAVSKNGRDTSCALMERWIQAHPKDPNAGRGLIWMAQLKLADGKIDQARPYFERARRDYVGTEWELHGIRGLADLDLWSWHFTRAIEGYQRLAQEKAPLWNYLGRMGVENARESRLRFYGFIAAAIGLLVLCGVRLRLARQAGRALLWPVPEEVTFSVPVFLLMIIAAFHQPVDEGRGVIVLAVAAMVLLWANGAYLRARPPKRWGLLREGVLGLAQAAALLYCCIVVSGLWEKFKDTLVMGAE